MNQPLVALANPDPRHTKAQLRHTKSELRHIPGTLAVDRSAQLIAFAPVRYRGLRRTDKRAAGLREPTGLHELRTGTWHP